MKLLFVSNLFPDEAQPWRGLDNSTLLHHLADHWEIRVLAIRSTLPWQRLTWRPRTADAALQPRYLPSLYVPKFGSRWNHRLMAGALRTPMREIRREFAFDVVLGSWIFPDCCALAELSPELAFPFVAIAQGSDVHQYLRVPARRRIILDRLPRARAIVTRSGELARLLIEAGLPAERTRPIYNGIDFACFKPGDSLAARRELGLPENGRVILFVGNFYDIKNPGLLVEAHARLCADPDLSDCRLVLIGGGPLADALQQNAAHLGTSDRVVFVGRKDAPAVARYMQAADVLALPSRNEGVPNVILEAFACGLPVVASRIGGIPEVHNAAELGRLFAEGNLDALTEALRSILQTPPARDRICAHAQQFSWERTTTAYDKLLRQAVS